MRTNETDLMCSCPLYGNRSSHPQAPTGRSHQSAITASLVLTGIRRCAQMDEEHLSWKIYIAPIILQICREMRRALVELFFLPFAHHRTERLDLRPLGSGRHGLPNRDCAEDYVHPRTRPVSVHYILHHDITTIETVI